MEDVETTRATAEAGGFVGLVENLEASQGLMGETVGQDGGGGQLTSLGIFPKLISVYSNFLFLTFLLQA